MGWGRTETAHGKDNGAIETLPPSLSLLPAMSVCVCACARVQFTLVPWQHVDITGKLVEFSPSFHHVDPRDGT